MKSVLAAIAAGLLIGVMTASQAKLPPPPPKSDADKAAEADKAKATKDKEAADLGKAQDKAVANYKKSAASMDGKKKGRVSAALNRVHLERATGLEPATSTLARLHSTN